jgi:hypothetical protein
MFTMRVTYDRFHANGDRIYRINQSMIWGDWNTLMSTTGPGVTEAIRSDIPDFEEVTRILFIGEQLMRVTNNNEEAKTLSMSRSTTSRKIISLKSFHSRSSKAIQKPR